MTRGLEGFLPNDLITLVIAYTPIVLDLLRKWMGEIQPATPFTGYVSDNGFVDYDGCGPGYETDNDENALDTFMLSINLSPGGITVHILYTDCNDRTHDYNQKIKISLGWLLSEGLKDIVRTHKFLNIYFEVYDTPSSKCIGIFELFNTEGAPPFVDNASPNWNDMVDKVSKSSDGSDDEGYAAMTKLLREMKRM